jgi:hypothetical protein
MRAGDVPGCLVCADAGRAAGSAASQADGNQACQPSGADHRAARDVGLGQAVAVRSRARRLPVFDPRAQPFGRQDGGVTGAESLRVVTGSRRGTRTCPGKRDFPWTMVERRQREPFIELRIVQVLKAELEHLPPLARILLVDVDVG